GPSNGESVLVALEWRLGPGRIEKVLRIQLLISQEFERSAVQLVAAGLGGHVDHAAHCASVLGGERISLDLELLDGVDRRLHHFGAALGACQLDRVVIDAVEKEAVLRIAHAAGAEASETRAGEWLRRSGRE